jgi:hypothetical protein
VTPSWRASVAKLLRRLGYDVTATRAAVIVSRKPRARVKKLSRGSLLEELTRTLHTSYFRQRPGKDEIKTWLTITTRGALWVEAQACGRWRRDAS